MSEERLGIIFKLTTHEPRSVGSVKVSQVFDDSPNDPTVTIALDVGKKEPIDSSGLVYDVPKTLGINTGDHVELIVRTQTPLDQLMTQLGSLTSKDNPKRLEWLLAIRKFNGEKYGKYSKDDVPDLNRQFNSNWNCSGLSSKFHDRFLKNDHP